MGTEAFQAFLAGRRCPRLAFLSLHCLWMIAGSDDSLGRTHGDIHTLTISYV